MNCPLCNECVPNYQIQNSDFYKDYLKLEADIRVILDLFETKSLKDVIEQLKVFKAKAEKKQPK